MNSENFISFSRTFETFKYAKRKFPQTVISLQQSGEEFEDNVDKGIKNCKVFEIDNGLKKLLCLTDPPNLNDEIFLPFKHIFIDVNFTKEELIELGIEIDALHIVGILFTEGIMISKDKDNVEVVGKDLNITMSSLQSNNEYWFDTFNKNISFSAEIEGVKYSLKENPTTDKRAREFIHRFIINFLNFVNNPEVEIVENIRSMKSIERRIKQGKPVIPSSIKIRLNGKLKEYVERTIAGDKFHFNYRFWVRGHFRNLNSPRYKDKKRIWILPYVKGGGSLIDKTYSLKEKKND